jgi:phosphomannomutase/phosphoglucomutase
VIDDKGQLILNDVLLAIYAMDVLKRFPHAGIVFNTFCTQLLTKVIQEYGGTPIMWRTGHSYIKNKLAAEKALFGGELSGHFFFVDNYFGFDDGAFAMLRLLEIISESEGQKLSDIYAHFPKYISSPEIKIGCPEEVKVRIVREITERFKTDFKNAEITDETVIPNDDGTRADFEDGMIIFRYSQNGPYVGIKFEAQDEDTYLERKKYVRRMLESFPEIQWKDELCVNLDSLN